ncbi:hypothetical protein [Streptomyces endophyticus]|uniref:Uncharacterized protein n=1 Tax=Streptomyces endophyticus TaxID=714166 RepID=A0ABU6FHP3_9ACTN|nr:hypothetical protein [Streptomyces endophyticus]MEB8343570.1 hypothetical protein [Streptomyces endophyticus]
MYMRLLREKPRWFGNVVFRSAASRATTFDPQPLRPAAAGPLGAQARAVDRLRR